jgi:Holliday junction resolvase
MVDSREKGKRAEYQVRDLLRERTGLGWERVPGSGGFSAVHGLKGDIYLPDQECRHCIEVKHYKDDTVNSLLLKNPDNQLAKFWAQTVREADEINKEPLLIFKKDRGQWLVAARHSADILPELIYTNEFREDKHTEATMDQLYIYFFSAWLATKNTEYFL